MKTHADINIVKRKYEEGFGFACMKAAYLYGITGRLDYDPENGIKIEAEGEAGNIIVFIKWIENNIKDSDSMQYKSTLNHSGKYKEFDIYLHSDNHNLIPQSNIENP